MTILEVGEKDRHMSYYVRHIRSLSRSHVLMLQEARTICDYLIVCIQTNPSADRAEKNKPIQSIVERQIQVAACKYVDEIIIYNTEQEVVEILKSVDWEVRIIGDEYRNKPFTGREETLDRCYFNRRPHQFSSSELRLRVIKGETRN